MRKIGLIIFGFALIISAVSHFGGETGRLNTAAAAPTPTVHLPNDDDVVVITVKSSIFEPGVVVFDDADALVVETAL